MLGVRMAVATVLRAPQRRLLLDPLAGSEDPAGRTCTGEKPDTLCRALHDGRRVSSLVCDGYLWNAD